jgi:AcrR family transcriptional regulator
LLVATSETTPRDELLEAAVRVLEESGPGALQVRSLTARVGASTQALYTHFGGMPALLQAIAAEGFARFAAHVRTVPETDDPVADFFAQGRAFTEWAYTHPELYRLMFGLPGGGVRQPAGVQMRGGGAVASSPEALDAIGVMVGSMERVIASGRIDPVDPVIAAGQFLSATHGFVLLAMAGALGTDTDPLTIVGPLATNLMVGLGDERARAERSLADALTLT